MEVPLHPARDYKEILCVHSLDNSSTASCPLSQLSQLSQLRRKRRAAHDRSPAVVAAVVAAVIPPVVALPSFPFLTSLFFPFPCPCGPVALSYPIVSSDSSEQALRSLMTGLVRGRT